MDPITMPRIRLRLSDTLLAMLASATATMGYEAIHETATHFIVDGLRRLQRPSGVGQIGPKRAIRGGQKWPKTAHFGPLGEEVVNPVVSSNSLKLLRKLTTATEQQTTKNRKLVTTPHTTKKPISSLVYSAPFLQYWGLYPRKIGKGDAWRAWNRIHPDPALLATILAKVTEAKAAEQWMRDGGQFIPHPATWLNRHGWEDDYTTPIAEMRYGRAGPDRLSDAS